MPPKKSLGQMTAWQRKWVHWSSDQKALWQKRVDELMELEGSVKQCAQYEAYVEMANE